MTISLYGHNLMAPRAQLHQSVHNEYSMLKPFVVLFK